MSSRKTACKIYKRLFYEAQINELHIMKTIVYSDSLTAYSFGTHVLNMEHLTEIKMSL